MTIGYEPTLAEVAYSAGFFDGEGCISIGLSNQIPRLVMVTAGTYRPVLEELQGWWGGKIYNYTGNDKHGWTKCWQWHMNGGERLTFLEATLPYLRVKRPAAEIAIRFLSLPKRVGLRLPTETLGIRQALLLEMRALPYRKSTPAQQLERLEAM